MIYIVTDQYGKKSLQNWDKEFAESKNFHKLTSEQSEFLAKNPNARVQEVEKCEIFSKFYFVKDSIGRQNIQIWEEDMRGNSSFTIFTPEQEAFYLQNPNANIYEVRNCKLFERPTEISVETYRELKMTEMSDFSLSVCRSLVHDYQVTNALCGVYDEEKAAEIIEKYKNIGTKCRNLYYQFVENVEKCASNAEIDVCVEEYRLFYNEVTNEE